MIKRRRRFKQAASFKDRVAAFADSLREKAAKMAPGVERDDLLKRAHQADTALHLVDWANSSGLQPPR
jgi:hypothetical protein